MLTPKPSKNGRENVTYAILDTDPAEKSEIRKFLRSHGVSMRSSQRYFTDVFSSQTRTPPKEIANLIWQKWLDIRLGDEGFRSDSENLESGIIDTYENTDRRKDCNPAYIFTEELRFGSLADGYKAFYDLTGNPATIALTYQFLPPGVYNDTGYLSKPYSKHAKTETATYEEPIWVVEWTYCAET